MTTPDDARRRPLIARVSPEDFPDTGRGHCVREATARGEVLLEIPLERAFTLDAARADADMATVIPCCARHDDVVALHVCLERHRGESAARASHVETLPRAFDTAFYWSEEERRELAGTACLRDTVNLIEETREDYE